MDNFLAQNPQYAKIDVGDHYYDYETFPYEFLRVPKKIYEITSDFGKRCIDSKVTNHNGVDIYAPEGTIIRSPISGQIVDIKNDKNGLGLTMTICGGGGGKVIYVILGHLSSINPNYSKRSWVKRDEYIARTGGTPGYPNAGTSTGPHLHIEVRVGGIESGYAVDPKPFMINDELVIQKTGRVIHRGRSELIRWIKEKDLKSQSFFKYSPNSDVTIMNRTEYFPKKKKVEPQKTNAKERLAPGIWQITKLLIDSSVADKQVLDAGMSTQQGSLLNFFRKVCQEPMVEFMGDTFGNQYYWIVRRPPFDKESFTKMMKLTLTDIDENDIIQTNLSWNNQGIYSWYQYIPYADLLGVRESALYVPAVFFPEFASVWGSRPLCVESNYFNFVFSGRFNSDKIENGQNGDRIIKNAIKDFKYIIESNAYNPFTRRGTITLIGDRRIKRGTLVTLPTTGEVFYVDSVNNSFDISIGSVNRTTTLNVSRGMYPNFINGKEIGDKKFSYFNIIDFGDTDVNDVTFDNWKSIVGKWKVNFDNFKFFMSKQQLYWENINKYRYVVDEDYNVKEK